MRCQQTICSSTGEWTPAPPGGQPASLVLVFGSGPAFSQPLLDRVHQAYPDACVAGCTTAGEISNDGVADETAVVTALQLEHTRCVPATVDLKDCDSSRAAGRRLAASLPDHQTLRHVLVFSDGLKVNGSDLVQGLTTSLPAEVIVTGGLSGDGSRFKSTAVVAGGTLREGAIVAIGFYGDRLRVGTGSLGGWDSFGLERLVTRADGNVLYELDGQSALSLYKKYLGEQARDLPASGLLFPLSVRAAGQTAGVVRTVLSVDEQADSMTFAGDIPVGSHARLMKANFDRLIDGAIRAARASAMSLAGGKADCALLISCVGRKMVLQQRVEEEIDGVRDVVGAGAVLTGFYSYGEISPFTPTARCELHNQTMTITTFAEL